jgi:acyl-CoA synthetase (AMP-forming)/AMP-acid ligase II
MAETVFAVTQTNTKETVRRLCVDRDKLQKEGLAIRSEPGPRSTVFLSNGFPISGCRVRILKSGEFVDDRVIGEVCIKSPWLFSGYHNNSDATRRAFKDGWLLSGDLGFLDCGELFLVGRSKDVIIVSGENVFAHDVEAAVSRVPNVKRGRAVAFGYYVEAFGSEKLVVVAERNSRTCDDAHLIRLINHAVLDEVGIGCGDVRLVDEGWLVKTTSGKMSRSENLSKYIEHFLSTRKV